MKDKTLNAVVSSKLGYARAKETEAIYRRLHLKLFMLSIKEARLRFRLLATHFGKAILEGFRYLIQSATHTNPKVFRTPNE